MQASGKLRNWKDLGNLDVTVDDIAHVVESWTGIPVQRISETEASKLLKLEERLHKRVVGQEMAVSALARAIRRTRSDFVKKKRPPALFCPTGVGKQNWQRFSPTNFWRVKMP